MTKIESFSAVDRSMEEDTSRTLTKPKRNHFFSTTNRRLSCETTDDSGDANEDDGDEECDPEAWETLSKSFREVQSVLDQNRALIQQVNDNHQSKIPDKLVQNVSLIKEINGNISKVMGIYSNLSVNFSNIVQHRRAMMKSNRGRCDTDGKVESSDS